MCTWLVFLRLLKSSSKYKNKTILEVSVGFANIMISLMLRNAKPVKQGVSQTLVNTANVTQNFSNITTPAMKRTFTAPDEECFSGGLHHRERPFSTSDHDQVKLNL